MDKNLLKAYGEMCFEIGRWRGQVDLEEDMDNNFFDAFLGVLYDKKTSMPLHTSICNGDEKAVRYKLRSDEWREGVKKTTKNKLDETLEMFYKLFKK